MAPGTSSRPRLSPPSRTPTRRIRPPALLEIPLTTCVYALCAALLGVSLFAPALLALWGFRRVLLVPLRAGAALPPGRVAVFCLLLGACAFVFFFCGLLVMSLAIRCLSLAVKPGRHGPFAAVTVAWMILNSIHTIAFRVILPLVPAGYFSTMYFRIAGCRIGKGVWLTTASLLDPYLISIGDGTVIGGDAILTAHLFGNGELFLAPIRIGRDCQIGAHALLCPGVTVGDGATVGIRAYLRTGRRIPAGAHVASVGGLPARDAADIERRLRPRKTAAGRDGI
jgi:acetyltransferase-like isoleucine patch superfamily enzyme